MEYKNNRQRTAAHPSGRGKNIKKTKKQIPSPAFIFESRHYYFAAVYRRCSVFYIEPHGDSRWKVEASEYDDHRPALDVQC